MRRTTLLSLPVVVSLLGIAAACSEQQPASPTAPATRTVAITQDVAAAPIPGAAKPLPAPTGFTQVTTVSAFAQIAAGGAGGAFVACPAGTTAISGGYNFTGYNPVSPPWVKSSRLVQNGWSVEVLNMSAAASGVGMYAFATCAS